MDGSDRKSGSVYLSLIHIYICRNRTLRVEDNELIVGNMGLNYRGTSISPDYGMGWLIDELDTGEFDKRDRQLEHMELSEEDREIFREMAPFWEENSASAFLDLSLIHILTLGSSVLPRLLARS